MPLPVPEGDLSTYNKKNHGPAPWHIHKTANVDRVAVVDDTIQMHYYPGGHGRSSGGVLFCNPWEKLPADWMTLSYEVYFPPEFDFVLCGKLPGVGFGCAPGEHSSGGEWNPTSGSYRLMWQKPEGECARIKGYLYLAIAGGPAKEAAWDCQGDKVKETLEWDDRTGYNLHYRKDPCFNVTRGQWNTISMSMTMNTPGVADGFISMTVNGVTKSYDDLKFREVEECKIQDLYWVSIFGGDGEQFAPSADIPTSFKNIHFNAGNNA